MASPEGLATMDSGGDLVEANRRSRDNLWVRMTRRMPFTLNTIVLLPLLRSLPISTGASIVAALISLTGLDFGVLGLGHPETAADDLVAWMMSFSVAVPVCWAAYMVLAFWTWATGFLKYRQERRS